MIKQGAHDTSFFILETGVVKIYLERQDTSELVATLQHGDYFGEMSLLTGGPRAATVVAAAPSVFYVLEKDDFKDIIQRNPAIFDRIVAGIISKKEELEQIKSSDVDIVTAVAEKKESLKNKIRKFLSIK